MIPATFEYHAPTSIKEATALLARLGDDAKVLSGGQSLIPLMKLRLASPKYLVDINGLPGLGTIAESDGFLRIGGLCRESDLEESELIRTRYPLILDTCRVIADPIVRNLATVGGNLAHGDPANDHPATMLALGAEVVAVGGGGERRIPIAAFFTGPFTTALRTDEILVEIRVPIPPARSGGAYVKLERKVGDFATAAVAVQVALAADGTCARAGIGLTNVGAMPIKASSAEAALAGPAPRRGRDQAGDRAGGRGGRARRGPARIGRVQDRPGASPDGARAAPGPRARGRRREVRSMLVKMTINGEKYEADVEPRLLLVHLIREVFRLTGTHIGCDTTHCGACTVLLDGRAVKSCTVFAVQANGRALMTVEGLEQNGELHPLQEGFVAEHGLQCGYCTPGMLMTSYAFLAKHKAPTEDDIRHAISGNLCRCTGYVNIVKAVQHAATAIAQGGS